MSIFEKTVKQFQNNTTGFAGVVLNNFNYTSSYGSYYKYYYYYYGSEGGRKDKNKKRFKNIVDGIKKVWLNLI